jgi:hypothetical protein
MSLLFQIWDGYSPANHLRVQTETTAVRPSASGCEFVLDQGYRLIRAQTLALFALTNRQPEGYALRVHCKTLVGESLMLKEDANMKDLGWAVRARHLDFKDTAIMAFSYLIYS